MLYGRRSSLMLAAVGGCVQSSSSSLSLSASDWLSLIIMSAPTAWLTARRNCFVLPYTPGILRVFCSGGFPYVIAPAFSTLTFSTPAIYFCIFHSCIFHPCCLLLLFPLLHFPLPHFQRPRLNCSAVISSFILGLRATSKSD